MPKNCPKVKEVSPKMKWYHFNPWNSSFIERSEAMYFSRLELFRERNPLARLKPEKMTDMVLMISYVHLLYIFFNVNNNK